MQKSYLVPLAEAPASDRMTFVTVMNFVMRNFRFMLVPGLILMVISPLTLIGRKPEYTTVTRFLTEAERPRDQFLGDVKLPGTTGRGPGFYLELMASPVVLENVARAPIRFRPGQPVTTLVEHYFNRPPSDSGAVGVMAGQLASQFRAAMSPSGVVTLEVKAEDPYVAAALARELLNQTDRFNATKLHSAARREREFAEDRLKLAGRDREAAEAALIRFNQHNRIVGSPWLLIEQANLQDSVDRKRALVSTLVGAIEQARLTELRETPGAIVLAPPVPPGNPSTISWYRIALVGLFAGMFIGALAALVRDYFRSIDRRPTPEAQEFAALRAASTEQLGKPFRAVIGAVRKPSRPTQLQ